MGEWRAVLFDLDDTLYPEREYVLSGFCAVAVWAERELGLPANASYAELAALHAAGVRGDTFDQWLTRQNQPLTVVPAAIAAYREHSPRLTPFPGIPALLRDLQSHFALGLVSDGYLAVQRRKLAALALEPSFRAIILSDEWGRDFWKPHPRPFETALRQLGVEAGQAVYVADNAVKDFLGARRVGMGTIWARYSGGDYTRLQPATAEHAPDAVADTLDTLRALLLGQA